MDADFFLSSAIPRKNDGRYLGFCILFAPKNIKVGTLINNEGRDLGIKKIGQGGSIGFSGTRRGRFQIFSQKICLMETFYLPIRFFNIFKNAFNVVLTSPWTCPIKNILKFVI